MTTAVLVHGGWHSASCWDLVRAELTADGIRSVAPQLPMTSTLDVDAAVVRELWPASTTMPWSSPTRGAAARSR